jgi:GR25 family glycosyltransferase involved in LPS biosynthesis
MIVKNESHIIVHTLQNILQYIPITYWVIVDTGSTDNTPSVIEDFFKEKKIPGELIRHEWKDFGYNRTHALECAYQKTDYIFLFDADDTIHKSLQLPPLTDDLYLFQFGDKFTYLRPLICNNRKKWRFKGVLHEFLEPLEPIKPKIVIKGNYYIESGRGGDRSKNPNKYKDDALVLEKAYEIEPPDGLKGRYAFYCAQSHRDAGNPDMSIEWYKKVVETKNHWNQEKYYASLQIGIMYHAKKMYSESLLYLLKTSEFDSERIEGIVLAMQYYSQTNHHVLVNALYYKYKNYKLGDNKLFVNNYLYNYQLELYNSISAYYVQDYQEGYECCKKILFHQTTLTDITLTIKNILSGYKQQLLEDTNTSDLFTCLNTHSYWDDHKIELWNILFQKNKDKFITLQPHSISSTNKSIQKYKKNAPTKILISCTCTDIQSFKDTIQSMMNQWKDIHIITDWVCIYENSIDINKIRIYPWIEYIQRNDNSSMNLIWEKLNKLQPKYWIHIGECIFYHSMAYVQPYLSVLDNNKYNIKQIMFNRNYGTKVNDLQIIGHIDTEIPNIVLHECKLESDNMEMRQYWPHYAIQPSICLVEPILQLGKFTTTPYFEYEYALQWHHSTYKTAFYNQNTYTSNPIDRYKLVKTNCTHPYIKVVNLERRFDRKQTMKDQLKDIIPSWIKAVDGQKLYPTDNLKKLIQGNNFNNKKGVIGCALSHLNIWKQLVDDSLHPYYIVLEDDITFADEWIEKINQIDHTQSHDLIWLGYHMWSCVRNNVKETYDVPSSQIQVHPFQQSNYIGGTFAYIIYKSGAQKLINYIGQYGIQQPIDNLMVSVSIKMMEIQPFLVFSPWCENVADNVDSDIQYVNDNLFLTPDINTLLNHFIFIPNVDQIGNDICYLSGTLVDILQNAVNNEKCVAVNTLGYLKHTVTNLSSSSVFKPKDGIFIKKTNVQEVSK